MSEEALCLACGLAPHTGHSTFCKACDDEYGRAVEGMAEAWDCDPGHLDFAEEFIASKRREMARLAEGGKA